MIEWSGREHISRWLHGEGLRNAVASLDRFLSCPASDPVHWLALLSGRPVAWLIVSRLDGTEPRYGAVRFVGDRVRSLDVFIGDADDLGRGYGTALISEFLERCMPDASDVVIDPEATNPCALHVYRKVGFRMVDTFIAPWHPVPHWLMHLPLLPQPAIPRPTVWTQVESLLAAFEQILTGTLRGFYLHGSLAFGCFNPSASDIDLLVVTDGPIPVDTKAELVRTLLRVSGSPHPVEISFLRRSDLFPWRHPAPFDLHFSEDWRERYEGDLADGRWKRWRSPAETDADLAAHIAVTHAAGLVLHGDPIPDTLPRVPDADLVSAIRLDLEWASERVTENPVYLVLNACRALAFLTERRILSKPDGGRWALSAMPVAFRALIADALCACEGEPGATGTAGAAALVDEHVRATALEIAAYVLART